MVYSSMSPQLFEHAPKILSLTLPPSQTKQIPCALLKLEYLHLVDSTPLAHSLKKQGGYTPILPISELACSSRPPNGHDQYGVRRYRAAFDQVGRTTESRKSTRDLQLAWLTAPRKVCILRPTQLIAVSRSIYKRRAILLRQLRFLLDIPKSSANIPMLSV